LKKCAVLALFFMFLSGCSAAPDEIETAMQLRSRILQSSACSFDTRVTADYGDKIHSFAMHCEADSSGCLTFTVTQPDSIADITGKITGEGGNLTFDDTALHFELVADGQLSPVSAPWVLLKTLRSGYVTSACRDDERILLSIDDSFEEDPLLLDIWLNQEDLPEQADILYDGRRILSVIVENFEIL